MTEWIAALLLYYSKCYYYIIISINLNVFIFQAHSQGNDYINHCMSSMLSWKILVVKNTCIKCNAKWAISHHD